MKLLLSYWRTRGAGLSLLFVLGAAQTLILAVLAPGQFTALTFFGSLAILLTSAVFASLFRPRWFGGGTESIGGRVAEYHDKLHQFLQDMPLYDGMDNLLNDLETLLTKSVGVKSYQMILLDETTRSFSIFRGYPEEGTRFLANLRPDSPAIEIFRGGSREYLVFSETGNSELEDEACQSLALFDPEICFPLMTSDEPFGLLLLGAKSGARSHSPDDLEQLTRLVRSLSLVVNQMRLKQHVLLAEELELLGRMSRGMAHDLNNLLTPVSTFLQLCQEAGGETAEHELMPVCLRNVGTIQAYVKEALFFSENRSLQLVDQKLDELIQHVVALADAKLQHRRVTIELKRNPPVTVQIDKILIQRLLGNVLSNAIDASQAGGSIGIDIQCIDASGLADRWARIRVMDAGEGISRKNLQMISSGYFTTKATGDEKRGFGLGLAICRKIVHLHGGNLDIASREGKGTTVRIDLPLRQAATSPEPKAELTAA